MRKLKMPDQRLNAVIYLRVSSEEQVQNHSLPTQQQRTIAHCTANGWPVVREFRDEGKSAKTTDREDFKTMVRFCSDPVNSVGYVVVSDLSRFSRQAMDQMEVRAQLLAAGVRLRSVSETIDETASGNLVANLFGAFNQFDNDRKAERTKAGMLKAASIGRWPHKAPLGYRNIIGAKKGPNIEPDSDTAPLMLKAFEMAATGLHSSAEILRHVNQLGLKTAKGKPVTPQTFQKTLQNPIYKGVIHLPEWDFTGPGSFTPLVDADLFDRVQDILTGRRPSLTEYQRNHPDFPLRVFVRCAYCGVGLTGSSPRGRNKSYPYYSCRTKGCRQISLSPDKLHLAFVSLLQRLTPTHESLAGIKDAVRAVWMQRQGDMDELRAILNQKLKTLEDRKATLFDKMLDGVIDQDAFKEHNARYRDEVEQIKVEIRGTELEGIELEKVLAYAERLMLYPDRMWNESSLEQRQRLQKTLFPNGLEFDGKEFGTAPSPLLFSLLSVDLDDDYGLASPTGFEPVLSP